LATAAQPCNRRLKQDEVSARLARVKPDAEQAKNLNDPCAPGAPGLPKVV